MVAESPTTRLSPRTHPPPPPESPESPSAAAAAGSSLFEQTLREARYKHLTLRELESRRKGKGKADHLPKRKVRSPIARGSVARQEEEEDEEEQYDQEIRMTSRDHPPTYEKATGQVQRRDYSQRSSCRTRFSSTSDSGDQDDDDDDDDDALSNLLEMTSNLLSTSHEILSASKSLHHQLSRFLLSSSPPSSAPPPLQSTSTPGNASDSLENEVRSELGLNGDNWDRLETLERDVERFGIKQNGRDPIDRLLRGGGRKRHSAASLPVTGLVEVGSPIDIGIGAEEEQEAVLPLTGKPSTATRTLGLGQPPGTTSSSLVDGTAAVAKSGSTGKGHLRRSSTARDLLMQLSSPPSTSTKFSPRASPAATVSSRRPSTTSRNVSSLDSDSPPSSQHHLNRLSISPSLPSLSSSTATTHNTTTTNTTPPRSLPLPFNLDSVSGHSSHLETNSTSSHSISPSLSISPTTMTDSRRPDFVNSSKARTSPSVRRQRSSFKTNQFGDRPTEEAEEEEKEAEVQQCPQPIDQTLVLPSNEREATERVDREGRGGSRGTNAAVDRLRLLHGGGDATKYPSGGSHSAGATKDAGAGGSWWSWR